MRSLQLYEHELQAICGFPKMSKIILLALGFFGLCFLINVFAGQAERDEGRVEDDPVVPIRDEEAHEFEDLEENGIPTVEVKCHMRRRRRSGRCSCRRRGRWRCFRGK